MNIYLVGYMGAGKTTAGRLLADRLGWRFVDLDDAFHEITGYSTAEYIRTHDMADFRALERDCVLRIADLPIDHVVFATGGGFPCWEDNMDILQELGCTVYLQWTAQQLTQRLLMTDLSKRPVLTRGADEMIGDSLEERIGAFVQVQLNARKATYEEAQIIVTAPDGCYEEQDAEIAVQLADIINNMEESK